MKVSQIIEELKKLPPEEFCILQSLQTDADLTDGKSTTKVELLFRYEGTSVHDKLLEIFYRLCKDLKRSCVAFVDENLGSTIGTREFVESGGDLVGHVEEVLRNEENS